MNMEQQNCVMCGGQDDLQDTDIGLLCHDCQLEIELEHSNRECHCQEDYICPDCRREEIESH